MGLRQGLAMLQQEGLDAVHARHRRLAGAVHAAVQGWAEGGQLNFFCRDAGARSMAVTAVQTAEGVNPDDIRSVARERFQVAIAGGLGPLMGRVFRIGHLGDSNEAMILGALAGIEAALRSLQIVVGPGTQRAIERLAASAE
jgi:alanine-glyoxylate transaminase / serine-glyoxylate transaminase / serine-pyruvate transaminase